MATSVVIDTTQPGRCRDAQCREVVYWRKEKSGKRNPYNPPKPCPDCKGSGGTVARSGVYDADFQQCERCRGKGKIQISHFATCIAAKDFRKDA